MSKSMISLALLAALTLAGCGAEKKNLSSNKINTGKNQGLTCPTAALTDFQEFTIHFSHALPAKIGVDVNGERKYDDCTRPAEKPPLATLVAQKDNTLVLTLEHWGAYDSLPRESAVTIYDLGGCATGFTPVPIFADEHLPLSFRKEYPNGKACPFQLVSRSTIVKQ